ncbi:TIGR00270 family protein [Candidatus Woesearchaeota archaeon]|jgi:putative transcription factor|nr:TIGR00270 family protein [Candidatus Woesearchaeota archaeon]MBT3537405.1 TIGR00270 family protein [Candidatus Woesearchaeota archaeon]MBT4697070.1 TIGR00270 family protein [Candidatus Woesearchaeota archaeon]MBT4717519.1 TIGR00270 family protein [Candidatus Woesearchaeota archaeon]MBT7106285.1 TIGR00270 family protein [Candidatus Woesearchaeota archaeon]
MPSCDMCGKEGNITKSIVEGTEMEVCQGCAKFGKSPAPKAKFKPKFHNKPRVRSPIPRDQENLKIVENYAEVIKSKREKMDITQEQLAKKVFEKESIVTKMESGHFKPSIRLARKLQKLLTVKLIEKDEAKKVDVKSARNNSGVLTIGDLLKKK